MFFYSLLSFITTLFLGDILLIILVISPLNQYIVGAIIIFSFIFVNLFLRLFQSKFLILVETFSIIIYLLTIILSSIYEKYKYNYLLFAFALLSKIYLIKIDFDEREKNNNYTINNRRNRVQPISSIVLNNSNNNSNNSINNVFIINVNVSSSNLTFDTIIHFCSESCNQRCECTICFESLDKCEIIQLSCNHIFHPKCILKWFESQKNDIKSCPLCRTNANQN